jgi:heme-degrading monooxygenase HmoA
MVSRHWTGVTKPGKAPDYITHLKKDTFPQLLSIAGFVRASILQRDLPEGSEFLIITDWENIEAIQAFAGAETDTAVVPQAARGLMLRFDEKVRHYNISHTELKQ